MPSYLTDITGFDDAETNRVSATPNVGGPTFLSQQQAAGFGVAYTVGSAPATYQLEITGGVDVDVYAEAVAASIPVGSVIDLEVTVTGDVTHLTWGTAWAIGTTFTLINQATIYGRGGDGGFEGGAPDDNDGEDGENAIELQGNTITVDNGAGNIWGGGGGGGACSISAVASSASGHLLGGIALGGGGGGGAGGLTTTGGDQGLAEYTKINLTPPGTELTDTVGSLSDGGVTIDLTQVATAGTDGGTGGPGLGGVGGALSSVSGPTSVTAGSAGDGGDFGEPGAPGTSAVAIANSGAVSGVGGLGGTAGKAIDLGGGSATFTSGNNPAQVKGDVS